MARISGGSRHGKEKEKGKREKEKVKRKK